MTADSKQKLITIFTQFKPGQRFYVFIVSITLASAFWVLNALNKTYNKSVHVVVKYINKPTHLAYTRIPPKTVEVQVRGDGFSLLQIENDIQDDTLIIDLSTLEFEQNKTRKKASIPSSTITNKIQRSLSNNLLISKVSVDSISIKLEPGLQKQLYIQPNAHVVLGKGLTLQRPIYAEPAFVEVYGPESRMSQIDTLFTDYNDFGMRVKSHEVQLPLIYDKGVLVPVQKEVLVKVDVEQITEGKIKVPVNVISNDNNLKVRVLPELVTVKYTTGLSHFDDITPAFFEAQVYYGSGLNAPTKLPVVINKVPNFINVVAITPERVDYLIINKK